MVHFSFIAWLLTGVFASAAVNIGSISGMVGPTIISPVQYQTFQRNGTTASIPITGMVGTGVTTIEARFAGGAWVVIANNASGAYSGVLPNQNQGQGTLEVRWKDSSVYIAQVENIGIGEVFIISGQSNASGRLSSNQSATGGLISCLFGNDYAWHALTDPSDTASGQLDSVSTDSFATGSIWPLLASIIVTNQNVPVAFVPCAKGGASIADWTASIGTTNRASLYGSMNWRAVYAISGGSRAVLMWEGETDAGNNVSQATFYNSFTNFTFHVLSDTGAKVMACKMQNCSGLTGPQQAAINAAIGQAWSGDSNSLVGPDLSGIDTAPEDTLHLTTTAKGISAATLWFNSIKTAFGW